MASRETVLARLRRLAGPAQAAPDPPLRPVRYPDPLARFERSLSEAGGVTVRVEGGEGLPAALARVPGFSESRHVHSAIPGLLAAHHGDLAGLDFALLAGAPAVAESGAVWVVPPNERSRSAAFLAQHLILVVPRDSVVHELHQAYAQIDVAATPYGCFIAGPSKTADIEQALVIGAHGPRSLHVLLEPPLA